MSVFISYRRDGGKPIAESIYQALCDEYNIFLDTESLKNGYFDSAIIEHIEDCSDFLVIITETVFDRCTDPNDWIFHEAQIALRENKNIIPIFVGIQKFPSNIPEPLQEICRYNGIFWIEKNVTCAKIKSFLVSNRRYRLSAIRSGDRIALSTETKEELKELYLKKYGVCNCVFIDEEGIESFYWTPFLWIDIIEELLKNCCLIDTMFMVILETLQKLIVLSKLEVEMKFGRSVLLSRSNLKTNPIPNSWEK